MKRIAWFFPVVLMSALTLQSYAQTAECKFYNVREYDDYMRAYREKDAVRQAAAAEKFLVDHPNADPQALTNVYSMMFLAYADAGNWAKILESFSRISLAPKLPDDQKTKFAGIASSARQRLGQ